MVDAPEPTEREVKELAYRLGGELPSSIDGPTLRRTAEALLTHYGYVSPRRHEYIRVQDAADVRRAVAEERSPCRCVWCCQSTPPLKRGSGHCNCGGSGGMFSSESGATP